MEPLSLKSTPLVGRAALRLQPDERLARLCSDGAEPAFDEIVRRYWGPLVGFAGTIVGPDRAEDVVQDSLLKAKAALGGEGRQIALKPWLYKIVRNASLNDIRDNRKHDHAELADDLDGVERPEDALARRDELASTVAAISGLPEAQRKALVGRELEGRSHAEIAAELSVTEGATKQLIHRARAGVRAAVGALIPLGLLRGLLGPAASAEAAAATGAGVAAGAGAGGVLGGLGGAGIAKVATVAALAGGAAVGGVAAVESGDGDRGSAAVRGPDAAGVTVDGEAPGAAASKPKAGDRLVEEEAGRGPGIFAGQGGKGPGNEGNGGPGPTNRPQPGTAPGKPGTAPGKPEGTPGGPGKAPGKPEGTPGGPGKNPGKPAATPGKPGTSQGAPGKEGKPGP